MEGAPWPQAVMSNARRQVKITGLGPVTPAGIGREDFYRGINEPVSRIRAITRFDPEAGQFVGAEIIGFRLNDYVHATNGKRLPRQTQFALASAMLALKDAGLEIADLFGSNPLVVCGSAMMDGDHAASGSRGVHQRPAGRASFPDS